jgi:hypothetical protein
MHCLSDGGKMTKGFIIGVLVTLAAVAVAVYMTGGKP